MWGGGLDTADLGDVIPRAITLNCTLYIIICTHNWSLAKKPVRIITIAYDKTSLN